MSVRPSIDGPLLGLVEALVHAAPSQLGAIDPARVLIISAAARKDAHASIRPLSFGGQPPRYESANGRHHKPQVILHECEMLYEIALRPRFFLDTTLHERVEILAHELFHIGPNFDGRLEESRRHARARRGEIDDAVNEIMATWRIRGEHGADALRGPTEVTLSAWRQRPPSRLLVVGKDRRLYTEHDLYPAVVSFAR